MIWCPSKDAWKSIYSVASGLSKQRHPNKNFKCWKFTSLGCITKCQQTGAQFPPFPIGPNHLLSLSLYLYFLAYEMKIILFTIPVQMGKSVMSLEPRVFFTINSLCVSDAVLNTVFKVFCFKWIEFKVWGSALKLLYFSFQE